MCNGAKPWQEYDPNTGLYCAVKRKKRPQKKPVFYLECWSFGLRDKTLRRLGTKYPTKKAATEAATVLSKKRTAILNSHKINLPQLSYRVVAA